MPKVTYARLLDDRVVEKFTPPEDETLEACFCPEVAAMFVLCPDDLAVGGTRVDGRWVAPPETPLKETP